MSDLAQRASAIAQSARTRVVSERERNRQNMPEATRIVDEIRSVFGPPVYLRFVENGYTVAWGQRPEWMK